MAFVSTKGSGVTWNPKVDGSGNEKLKATEEDVLDGYYVNRKEGIGPHLSTVFSIQKDDGETVDVWGDTVLTSEMSKPEVRLGAYVRLQWHGKRLKKPFDKPGVKITDKNSFHNWEVFIDNDVPLLNGGTGSNVKPETNYATSGPSNVKPGSVAGQSFAAKQEDDLPF